MCSELMRLCVGAEMGPGRNATVTERRGEFNFPEMLQSRLRSMLSCLTKFKTYKYNREMLRKCADTFKMANCGW